MDVTNEACSEGKVDVSDELATDEQIVQGLQTAAGFAENVVKRLYAISLHKSITELFGDEMTDHIGGIKLDPKQGSGACGYSLKLDIVPSSYKVDMFQFKKMPYVYDEMVRLLSAAEYYFQYCKKTYNLPDISLWRSYNGTLYICGAPDTIPHIGIKVSTF